MNTHRAIPQSQAPELNIKLLNGGFHIPRTHIFTTFSCFCVFVHDFEIFKI